MLVLESSSPSLSILQIAVINPTLSFVFSRFPPMMASALASEALRTSIRSGRGHVLYEHRVHALREQQESRSAQPVDVSMLLRGCAALRGQELLDAKGCPRTRAGVMLLAIEHHQAVLNNIAAYARDELLRSPAVKSSRAAAARRRKKARQDTHSSTVLPVVRPAGEPVDSSPDSTAATLRNRFFVIGSLLSRIISDMCVVLEADMPPQQPQQPQQPSAEAAAPSTSKRRPRRQKTTPAAPASSAWPEWPNAKPVLLRSSVLGLVGRVLYTGSGVLVLLRRLLQLQQAKSPHDVQLQLPFVAHAPVAILDDHEQSPIDDGPAARAPGLSSAVLPAPFYVSNALTAAKQPQAVDISSLLRYAQTPALAADGGASTPTNVAEAPRSSSLSTIGHVGNDAATVDNDVVPTMELPPPSCPNPASPFAPVLIFSVLARLSTALPLISAWLHLHRAALGRRLPPAVYRLERFQVELSRLLELKVAGPRIPKMPTPATVAAAAAASATAALVSDESPKTVRRAAAAKGQDSQRSSSQGATIKIVGKKKKKKLTTKNKSSKSQEDSAAGGKRKKYRAALPGGRKKRRGLGWAMAQEDEEWFMEDEVKESEEDDESSGDEDEDELDEEDSRKEQHFESDEEEGGPAEDPARVLGVAAVLQELRAIVSEVMTTAQQQQREDSGWELRLGGTDTRSSSKRGSSKRKGKVRVVRSRNTVIDRWMKDLEGNADSYADLEDFLVDDE